MPLPRAPLSCRSSALRPRSRAARAHAARRARHRRASALQRDSRRSSPGFAPRGGGLRGGSFDSTDAFDGQMTLRDYSYVPGVRVSGTLTVGRLEGPRPRAPSTGRVSGSLDVRSTTAASGVLGGRTGRVLARGRRAHGRRRPAAARFPRSRRAAPALSGPAPAEAVNLEQRFRGPGPRLRARRPRPGRQGGADEGATPRSGATQTSSSSTSCRSASTPRAGARCSSSSRRWTPPARTARSSTS